MLAWLWLSLAGIPPLQGPRHTPRSWVIAAGWVVPALQGCGTTAELPEMLPCSPRCCVFTHPGWRWGTVLWWAPTAGGAHTLQRGLHVPSPQL